MSGVTISKIGYKGWNDCLHISNDIVEAVILTEVGIRIIHYGFVGEDNMFFLNPAQLGTKGTEWQNYGGHRIWHSPQVGLRCNEADNDPIEWEETENGVLLKQKTEKESHIEKQLEFCMSENGTEVSLRHELFNRGVWPVEFAVWPLTMMRQGGISIVPISRKDTVFLPNFNLVYWPFTKLDDERAHIGSQYFSLKGDRDIGRWFKIGFPNIAGWASYFSDGDLFVKKFAYREGAAYPDFGCSYETYTDEFFVEMESLSPLLIINPDESIIHAEEWFLVKDVSLPSNEKDMDEIVQKYIASSRIEKE